MTRTEEEAPRKQNLKLPAKKKDFRSESKHLKISTEMPPKSQINVLKNFFNDQADIKLQ